MSSPNVAAPKPREPVLRPLLDIVFGFVVWAVHLLVVYAGTSVLCVLGLERAGGAARPLFLAGLAVATGLAALIVVLHAVRRYRVQRAAPALRLRMFVTVGGDALAAVAIVWQLFPVSLIPPCI